MTGKRAVFTRGPTLTHVVRMTLASTVDLVDMFFLSLLGEQELVAAVGFGGALLFFLTAVSIGLQIGMGALVSRAEGAHQRELAGRYCTNILVFSGLAAAIISAVAWSNLEPLLRFLGAEGKSWNTPCSTAASLFPIRRSQRWVCVLPTPPAP